MEALEEWGQNSGMNINRRKKIILEMKTKPEITQKQKKAIDK